MQSGGVSPPTDALVHAQQNFCLLWRRKHWASLEQASVGVKVTNTLSQPLCLDEVTTLCRNKRGRLLARPTRVLCKVGMDIGYGEGVSPGGYRYTLLLVNYAMDYAWMYGLQDTLGLLVSATLQQLFIDAGGLPQILHCDFDKQFLGGAVAHLCRVRGIHLWSAPSG